MDRAAVARVLSALPLTSASLSRRAGLPAALSIPTVARRADTIKHLFERVSTLSDPG